MNILLIAQLFPPDMGGGSTRAYNVAKGLSSLGHKVTVVTAFPHYPSGKISRKYRFKPLSVERLESFKVFRTWVPPLASIGVFRRLILFLSFCISSLFVLPFVGSVDIAWAANPNIFSVFSALFYKRTKGCSVVQNVDDLWPEVLYELNMIGPGFLRRSAEYVSKFTYKMSDAITPISPAYIDVITSKYGISPKKMHVIPAGVDYDKFALWNSNTEIKEKVDVFKVLYIGALSPAYDFDQVMKAAKLLSSMRSIKFIIQGGGDLASSLKSKVKEMGLSNVAVVLKIVNRDQVVEALHHANVLLLPLNGSRFIEMGISSKLYEYQAAGKPIVCCSSGQPARYVSETKCGIVVKPGNYVGLANAIIRLYQNKEEAKNFGEAGRYFAMENLSLEKIGLRMSKVFEAAMSSTSLKGILLRHSVFKAHK